MPEDDPELEVFVARAGDEDTQTILALIADGLADYENPDYYGPSAKRDHIKVPGVDAACRNCHIVARALRLAEERPGFLKVHNARNRVTFILRDNIEVWFKKLDEQGRPRYRRSKQSDAYLKPHGLGRPQGAQAQLIGASEMPPELFRVVAGYRAGNAVGTAWDVLVAGRRKSGGWWQAPLFTGEISQLAKAPAPEVAKVVRSRVTVQPGAKRTRDTNKKASS